MLQPDSVTVTALAQAVSAPVSTVHREVARLEDAGLLVTRRVGRARLVSANEANPATPALRELVLVAFGPRQVIAEEFRRSRVCGSSASSAPGLRGTPVSPVACQAMLTSSSSGMSTGRHCMTQPIALRLAWHAR
jgi:hypothetical protein